MKAPDVQVVEGFAEEVRRLVDNVVDQYRWFHSAGFTRRVRTSGASSPTPSEMVEGEAERIRSQLGVAGHKLVEAVRALGAAERALRRAEGILAWRDPAVDTPPEKLLGEPISRAEKRHAEAAQERREGRRNDPRTPWARDEVTG